MSGEPDIRKLTDTVIGLQKDMAQVGTLVDRLDITIEKLTEVSSTVSQLLAVQGSRLEFQEKIGTQLQDLVEKRRVETEVFVKDLHQEIESVERELETDMKENNEKVLTEIKSLRTDGEKQHIELNDRMTRLEKWMWIVVGGGVVVAFILSKINIAGLF